MEVQRKKELFEKGKIPELIRVLESGRIAVSIYNNGIAIIDPQTLEISFMIEEPCLTFIELGKDTLALIKRVEYGKNEILLIKIEEKNYTALQKSFISSFIKLAKPWDETLIASDNTGICFFKGKNNLSEKDFFIDFKDGNPFISSIFQTKKNEIVYDQDKIIFYDFVEKKEKKLLNLLLIPLQNLK